MVSGLGFQVSGSGLEVSGSEFRDVAENLEPGTKHLGTWSDGPNLWVIVKSAGPMYDITLHCPIFGY